MSVSQKHRGVLNDVSHIAFSSAEEEEEDMKEKEKAKEKEKQKEEKKKEKGKEKDEESVTSRPSQEVGDDACSVKSEDSVSTVLVLPFCAQGQKGQSTSTIQHKLEEANEQGQGMTCLEESLVNVFAPKITSPAPVRNGMLLPIVPHEDQTFVWWEDPTCWKPHVASASWDGTTYGSEYLVICWGEQIAHAILYPQDPEWMYAQKESGEKGWCPRAVLKRADDCT